MRQCAQRDKQVNVNRNPRRWLAGGACLVMMLALLGGDTAWAGRPIATSPHTDRDLPYAAVPMLPTEQQGQSPYVGPESASLAWRYVLVDSQISSPAVGQDGTVYVAACVVAMDDGRLRCTGPRQLHAFAPDKRLKWRYEADATLGAPTVG